MKSDPALSMYSKFKDIVSHGYGAESASKVKDGEFGAMMDVALVNDGPVTLVIDSREDQGALIGEMIPALRRVGPDERRHEHDAQHDEYTYIR